MQEIIFEIDKDTKNTIRFKEVLENPLDVDYLGTIYVPKSTLKAIGYEAGKQLVVTLEAR